MPGRQHQRSASNRRRQFVTLAAGFTVACTLLGGLASAAGAAERPSHVGHVAAAPAPQPSINSVSFSGTQGSGEPSPTITVTGSNFGTTKPAGTSDNMTSCGDYTHNGEVYGAKLYFTDNNNFEAGYSYVGATCIGIIVQSWSTTQVVLRFGNAYGTFAHWYLTNGDGYAISIKTAIWGGDVSGLS